MDIYCLRIWDLADVWSLTWLTIHTTQAHAHTVIVRWVYDRWDEGLMDGPPSDDTDQDVSDFFTAKVDEYRYSIERKTVYGPKKSILGSKAEGPFDPDEVPLDPVEVRAVVYALRTTQYTSLAKEIGANPHHAADMVHRIIDKLTD